MKLCEILTPKSVYYLAANTKVDQVVTRAQLNVRPNPQYHLAQHILEQFRPDNCLSRKGSILLAKSPQDLRAFGQKANLIYPAEPLGDVQWSDTLWVQKISAAVGLPVNDRPSCEEWARSYWAGTECRVGDPIWEGRVHQARIIDPRLLRNPKTA